MPNVRAALALLPRGAITGIGSLPHTQMELALQMALAVDVPYLPQLPTGNPSELMVPAALEGLPGLDAGDDGVCGVDLGTWEAGRGELDARIDLALKTGDASAFLPGVAAARALRPFLWEVRERKLAFAKAQIAGPATVRWSSRLSTGEPLSEHPGLDAQVFRLVLVRALALVQALRAAGATVLFYLDEPGLYALDTTDPSHLAVLSELRLLVTALRQQGALVGLHCCGNTRWSALLELGIDLLSFDVRLSLDAVLDEPRAVRRFLDQGGAFSLGLVPTDLGQEADPRELARAVETSFAAALPDRPEALRHVVTTPACGLAMRSVLEAERIFEQLRTARSALLR
ncbi:MAG TPA: hypothetical protein VLT82_06790 [Myxococcaceae bacterium]|nr:hypothetical protein [Myxococcaceae bacterium]